MWPDVERRLRALLFRRGLDQASAEDVVQEVALRALAGRVTYTSAKDLLRWAGPVACNLHIDLLRQRARLQDGGVGTDHPASNDVAGEVADRMELQRAFRGLAALRPADREAIMEAVTAEPVPARNRKEAVRLAVRRHRARSRLALVMEQLAAWTFGAAWLRRSSRAATVAIAAVPIAALPLVLSLQPPREPAGTPVRTPVTESAQVRTVNNARVAPAEPATTGTTGRAPARRAPAREVAGPRATITPTPATIEVMPAEDTGVKAGGDDRRPDDKTVCARNLPYLPDVCV
ncbi:MAG TPA: sigma-70 family RNA polymerase sigma factor [Frankiaceae bacterium]|nr:sigma-70 family RNA polymerase sigma factor [Frankiaceae bacterium]